ncbi:MAG: hypothetical protein MJZ38_01120 [archaeon]|nr:hypothetical protein [archaeon]
MDKKIIAILAVVIIVAAGAVAGFTLLKKDDGKEAGLSIVGRVNSEGSGIILKNDQDPHDYITETLITPVEQDAKYIRNGDEYFVFNVANWGGKVFATPGAATIQHVQLAELAALMGLKFVSYVDGTALSNDTLYYQAGVPSYAEFSGKAACVGFIIWEAQVSVGVQEGCPVLALTNDLFAGHTCCIIGASNDYVKKNADTLETFLFVYSKAVDKINEAKADPTSDLYNNVLAIAKNRVSMPDGLNDSQKEAAIKAALDNVTYLYADGSTGNLGKLVDDVAALAKSLVDSNVISKNAKDLGFADYSALANKFVNDVPMKNAMSKEIKKLDKKTTIEVAAIAGDIHQLAIWYAKDTGMFEEYNLDVNVSAQSNGPAIYTVLANGEVNIGFLGAPPMTIRCMNAEDIHA